MQLRDIIGQNLLYIIIGVNSIFLGPVFLERVKLTQRRIGAHLFTNIGKKVWQGQGSSRPSVLVQDGETGQTKASRAYIITGNTILDSVINEKYEEACRRHIDMTVNISLPEGVGTGTGDLCTVLNHTLDYALTRCEAIMEAREKNIRIEGVWYKGYLMFKLYYTVPTETLSQGQTTSNKRIRQAIIHNSRNMRAVKKKIRKYEGDLKIQECGWGEEKLTFNLNVAGHYVKMLVK